MTKAPRPVPPHALNHTVLVIDDDQDIREILSEILTEAGYAVVAATNGSEALAKLAHVQPSLILLDLNMPVMDGVQFRHAQRRDPATARIPTVVMSAAHAMSARVAGLDVAEALQKPLELDQLMAVVARYCR